MTDCSKSEFALKSLIYQKTEMHYFFLMMAYDEDDPDDTKSYFCYTLTSKEML